MRVIAGIYKGRRLECPPGQQIRPMPDRLKEALFNILQPWTPGSRVLDLCCGTGAVGIEALSRGAAWVTFLDSWTGAIKTLRQNLSTCGIESNCAIISREAPGALKELIAANEEYDLIFFDPPYRSAIYEPVMEILGDGQLLRPGGRVIVMHHAKRSILSAYGCLERYRGLQQGENVLSFFSIPEEDSDGGRIKDQGFED